MLILSALRPIIKWKVQGGKKKEQTVQSRLRCPLRLKVISSRKHKEKRQMVTYGLKSKQRWHVLTNERGGDSTIRSLDQDHQSSGSTARGVTRPEHPNTFKTLRSHPWLPNWTGPQTFLQLHHNYKHDATGFCGVMEGKGEREIEEEEKWVRGTTGGNNSQLALKRGWSHSERRNGAKNLHPNKTGAQVVWVNIVKTVKKCLDHSAAPNQKKNRKLYFAIVYN